MVENILIGLLLVLSSNTHGEAANILALPIQYPSHIMMFGQIVSELVPQGHNITFLLGRHFDGRKYIPAGTNILYHDTVPGEMHYFSEEFIQQSFDNFLSGRIETDNFSILNLKPCRDMFLDQAFMDQLKGFKYDLAIVDINIYSYCTCAIPYTLGIPWIGTPLTPSAEVNRIPLFPSYVVDFDTIFTDSMTFKERLENFYHHLRVYYPMSSKYTAVAETELLNQIVKAEDKNEITSWMHLARRTSLFFLHRDFLLENPVPLYPNIIPLGGLSAREAEPIEGKLGDLLDSATQGFILVSMGSSLNYLPQNIMEKFLKAFSKREELVIFRFDGKTDNLEVPANVKFVGHIPQNDVLGHKNIKLFVNHAGTAGQYEALYHAVPMLSVPIFGDQPHNAVIMEKRGIGIKLEALLFTPEDVLNGMHRIIDGIEYKKNALKYSKIIKSRPMNVRQVTAYWIEHILEFGDEHLKTSAIKMPWYSFYMLDIFAFHITILLVLCMVVHVIFKGVAGITIK